MRRSIESAPSSPRRRAGPFSPWEKVRMRVRAHPAAPVPVIPAKAGIQARMRVQAHPPPRVDDKEWNEMQPNATELKVSPLLATPVEAKQGHNQGRLAQRLRVNGVPNEATVASFSASRLGVNRAKQGQMGPVLTPNRRSRAGGNLASPPLCPRHSSEGWNPGEVEGSGDGK